MRFEVHIYIYTPLYPNIGKIILCEEINIRKYILYVELFLILLSSIFLSSLFLILHYMNIYSCISFSLMKLEGNPFDYYSSFFILLNFYILKNGGILLVIFNANLHQWNVQIILHIVIEKQFKTSITAKWHNDV